MAAFYTARHYNTYYFANIISNVLDDIKPYLHNMEDFVGEEATQFFLEPFPRWSLLHTFIAFIVHSLFMEPDDQLSIEQAFNDHRIEFESFEDWKQSPHHGGLEVSYDDWHYELPITEAYEKLIPAITREVFAILFTNRKLLLKLNAYISWYIKDCEITEDRLQQYRNSNGQIKRQPIPQWTARAVFYRDRGRCCTCQADLTGLLSPNLERHIDHMIPLSEGGINDVTNLQILCASCNLTKGSQLKPTSDFYEAWYDDETK